jgi:hypothetical protein
MYAAYLIKRQRADWAAVLARGGDKRARDADFMRDHGTGLRCLLRAQFTKPK